MHLATKCGNCCTLHVSTSLKSKKHIELHGKSSILLINTYNLISSIIGKNMIFAGSTYLEADGQLVIAEKGIPHPDFRELTIAKYNDYGLIVLGEPLVFNENVRRRMRELRQKVNKK